jgi:hypothetical protein
MRKEQPLACPSEAVSGCRRLGSDLESTQTRMQQAEHLEKVAALSSALHSCPSAPFPFDERLTGPTRFHLVSIPSTPAISLLN